MYRGVLTAAARSQTWLKSEEVVSLLLLLLLLLLSLSQSSLSLCSGCLASVRSCEEMIHQVQAKRKLLKEQVKKAMDDFKQLLDTRQAVSTHTVPLVLS